MSLSAIIRVVHTLASSTAMNSSNYTIGPSNNTENNLKPPLFHFTPFLNLWLDGIQLIDGKITLTGSDEIKRLTFERQSMSNLYDVNLISSNGTTFGCHKCILVARLDYFHSMLSTCWAELFSFFKNFLIDSDDIEFLCHILMISDQLLVPRLKEICEMALIKQFSLKNAAELLELSSVYNSEQLKKSCMQFICINLPAVIESNGLKKACPLQKPKNAGSISAGFNKFSGFENR
ncbi:UNVERIFIED_CONTAM: ibtk [Trichonephila clavipes]